MLLHCSIRSPREERLYYNRSAKGHAPLARKQPPPTCLMSPGISGSRKIQGRTGCSRKVELRSCIPCKRKMPKLLLQFFFPLSTCVWFCRRAAGGTKHETDFWDASGSRRRAAAGASQWCPGSAVEVGRPVCISSPAFMGITSLYWWGLCLENSRG